MIAVALESVLKVRRPWDHAKVRSDNTQAGDMRTHQEDLMPLFGEECLNDTSYTLSSSRCAVIRQFDELALRLVVGDAQPALLIRLCPEHAADLASQLPDHLALLKAQRRPAARAVKRHPQADPTKGAN